MRDLTRREFARSVAAAAVAGPALARQAPAPAGRTAATPPTAQEDTLAALSLADAAARLSAGQVTSVDLTRACLARIAIYKPKLNAFITVLGERAVAEARALDEERRAGKVRGPLHGIPDRAQGQHRHRRDQDDGGERGVRRSRPEGGRGGRAPPEAGGRRPDRQDEPSRVRRGRHLGDQLFRSRAQPVGARSQSRADRRAARPRRCRRRSATRALGTDTGGSIRTPSSNCSTVGLKPTYGLVSIRGIVPLVFSLDHCGPITRTVRDAAIVLQALAGYDRLDIASVEHPREDYVAALDQPVKGLRLGDCRGRRSSTCSTRTSRPPCTTRSKILAGLTREVKDCSLPPTSDIVLTGEMSACHLDLFEQMAGRYMVPTRRNLQGARDFRAAEYIRGRWKLELLRRTIDDAFADVDLVVLPTRKRTPRTVDASLKREQTDVPRNPELENTNAFNAYGIPAISVPCGFNAQGLPIGLMIAGPRFSEGRVLALAQAFEKATEWHTRRPPIRPDTPLPPLATTEDDPR